jgi:hypothetical protein
MIHVGLSAPVSAVPVERRGRVVGRYCRVCHSIYPLHAPRHSGRTISGRDHISSTCSQEGLAFAEGATWWEPAVELLPAPSAAPAPATA